MQEKEINKEKQCCDCCHFEFTHVKIRGAKKTFPTCKAEGRIKLIKFIDKACDKFKKGKYHELIERD